MKVPDFYVGKRLFCGLGKPDILGRGPTEVRGSAYLQGPEIIGDPGEFNKPNSFELGSTMVSQCANPEMKPIPFYGLFVTAYARIKSFLKVDMLLNVRTITAKVIYAESILAKTKNFSIPHPQQPNVNLVYACLEGPENGVYVRGRLKNSNIIKLPEVWTDLVHANSITVCLTPIGSKQNLIVRRATNNQVLIESDSFTPIDCYYHIYAERKDVSKLKTEVTL